MRALGTIVDERSSQELTVAVVYWAEHMRAVARGLRERGFRVYTGEWLTAMLT